MIPDLTPAEIKRFYSKILIDGCGMLWNGPVNNHGYGRFQIRRDGKRVRILAHRLSYKLATGEDPGPSKMRHGCDNPPCVTPDCLEPGTAADNMHDAIVRGRANTSGLTAYREQRDEAARRRATAMEKACNKCGKTKPMNDFQRCSKKIDGHKDACRDCRNEAERVRLRRKGAA